MRAIERTESGRLAGDAAPGRGVRRAFWPSVAVAFCFATLLGLLGLGARMDAVGAPPTPLTEQETRAAQKLYHVKCAKCHKFYPPEQYSDEDWHMWMEKMAKKSKLKPAQSTLLNRYLDTIRTSPVK